MNTCPLVPASKKRSLYNFLPPLLLILCSLISSAIAAESTKTILEGHPLDYKVGFLGNPSSSIDFEMTVPVSWTSETIGRLKKLGFNTIQINVAWGTRPDDEPLNLEDIVRLTPEQEKQYPQVVPLRSKAGEPAREKRREELRRRIALCQAAGLRTLFHFGAPYNAHARYGDGPPNCLRDEKMTRRYELLLDALARDFPGVDDLLIYTYDQDAWLCSEFGPCPRCLGIPLDQRLAPFLDPSPPAGANPGPRAASGGNRGNSPPARPSPAPSASNPPASVLRCIATSPKSSARCLWIVG
jgi:hypothetical protein